MTTWTCVELGLTITADGDGLAITKDGRTYRAIAAATTTAPAAKPGNIYRHPTGGELDLPDRWQVTQSQLGLQLVPPDAAFTPQGPAEIYVLAAQKAPGIARADDPRVVAYIDQTIRQLVPTLGPASPPAPEGDGIAMRWTGMNPMTGAAILAVAILRVVGDTVSGAIGIGETPRVEARFAQLASIVASFRKGEGRRDPNLVGVWHHWSYRSSGGGYSSSSFSSETRKTWQLHADGTLVEGGSHEGIGSFPVGGYASQSSDGRHGRWTAGDGGFYIEWSDGQSSGWQYQIVGTPGSRRLVLTSPGQREPYEWTEKRVNV